VARQRSVSILPGLFTPAPLDSISLYCFSFPFVLCIAGTLECEAAKEEEGLSRCVLVKDLQQDSFSCPFANIQKIRLLPSGKEGVSRQSKFAPDTTDGRLYNTLRPEWNPWGLLKKEKGIDH